MRKFLFGSYAFISSLFFVIHPTIEAMNNDTWNIVDVQFRSEKPSDQNSTTLDTSQMILTSEHRLQKMKFNIMVEAHKRISHPYNLMHFYDTEPQSWTDDHIDKAMEDSKLNLYSPPVNIKEWQILKTILGIIDEKLAIEDENEEILEHLNIFKNQVLKQCAHAINKRKDFLKGALKIAAQLRAWMTFYTDYKLHLETNYPKISKNILDLLQNDAKLSKCSILYQSKDSITNSLDLDLQECKSFISDIKNLLHPLLAKEEKHLTLLEYIQMEKFLEEKKIESNNLLVNFGLAFNKKDEELFLSVIIERLKFYSSKRLEAEDAKKTIEAAEIAQLKYEAAKERMKTKIAEAERLASEAKMEQIKAQAEIVQLKCDIQTMQMKSRTEAETLEKACTETKVEIARIQYVDRYVQCNTIKKLYLLYALALPEPESMWNCEQFKSPESVDFLPNSYNYQEAEQKLLDKKPLHLWLKLDLRLKALHDFQCIILPQMNPLIAEKYRSHLTQSTHNTYKEIKQNKAHFSAIFQKQLRFMLHHALLKRLVDKEVAIFSAKDSQMPPSQRLSIKDSSLRHIGFYSSWTDYLGQGLINHKMLESALEDCMTWERNLRYPLNYWLLNELLNEAWDDMQHQQFVYTGRSSDDPLCSKYQPEGADEFFKAQLQHYHDKYLNTTGQPLDLRVLKSPDTGLGFDQTNLSYWNYHAPTELRRLAYLTMPETVTPNKIHEVFFTLSMAYALIKYQDENLNALRAIKRTYGDLPEYLYGLVDSDTQEIEQKSRLRQVIKSAFSNHHEDFLKLSHLLEKTETLSRVCKVINDMIITPESDNISPGSSIFNILANKNHFLTKASKSLASFLKEVNNEKSIYDDSFHKKVFFFLDTSKDLSFDKTLIDLMGSSNIARSIQAFMPKNPPNKYSYEQEQQSNTNTKQKHYLLVGRLAEVDDEFVDTSRRIVR